MRWNDTLPWHNQEFQFLDMFSGTSNASRVWSLPRLFRVGVFLSAYRLFLRKGSGFNSAHFDLEYGKAAGRPEALCFTCVCVDVCADCLGGREHKTSTAPLALCSELS